jgi:penicillin-binding protein 2
MIRILRSSFSSITIFVIAFALIGSFYINVEAKKSSRSSKKASSKSTSKKSSRSKGREAVASRGRRGRKLSRRERLAEARRRAAELRRRRAIAEARRRAADQALRDEAMANINRDSTVGEDLEVRRAAIEALGNHAGTVVVMNPKNGRIYTVVNQDWALRRGFKPCSTIKLVTGLAGVCEKVIDPDLEMSASESYRLDLTDSLAYSNNPYFQNVGGKVGFDRIMFYARQMGLGEKTGVNYPNESPGRVPFYKTGYSVNHMCSHGDDFEVTPIQLATLVSAIVNGGKLLVPHTPRTPQEDANFKPIVRRKLDIPEQELRRLVPGMIGAVNYGSGKLAYDPVQTIGGKTGTCIGQGSWLGLFTSVAPIEDPNLSVVVVTRGSRERGKIAAGIAGKIYRALNNRFGKVNGQFARSPQTVVPKSKVDPNVAAAVSDEDKEADEAEAAANDENSGDIADDPIDTQTGTKPVIKSQPLGTTQPKTNGSSMPSSNQQRPRRVVPKGEQ